MQTAQKYSSSPEVREYAEYQRMREYEIVNAEVKTRWWRKLGAKVLGAVLSTPERQSLEWQRLRMDQITEASERLNGAMENPFEYAAHNGELYFQQESLRPIFIRGIRNTEEIMKTQPQFGIELLRRHIELKQYDEQVELLRQVDWQDPTFLVHISPTPDAVLNDGVDLNAYDTDRKKIMVRISEPTMDGLRVTSLSLDGNDRLGLQAMGDFLGLVITDDMSSEDILALAGYVRKSHFGGEHPAKVLREKYDSAMRLQYGGEWYAGRRDSDVLTTMQKIMRFPELADKHTDEVMQLKRRLGQNFRFTKEYEDLTFNYLAAIEQSYKTGVAVTRLSVAGAGARASGMTFAKSGCPTGAVVTAEQALAKQGIGERAQHWHTGTCQACLEEKMVGDCSVCMDCEAADNRGEDLMAIRARALAAKALRENSKPANASASSREVSETSFDSKEDNLLSMVKQVYGDEVVIDKQVVVGGTESKVINRHTGEVLIQNIQRDFALAA